jgi:hypothetical protein
VTGDDPRIPEAGQVRGICRHPKIHFLSVGDGKEILYVDPVDHFPNICIFYVKLQQKILKY